MSQRIVQISYTNAAATLKSLLNTAGYAATHIRNVSIKNKNDQQSLEVIDKGTNAAPNPATGATLAPGESDVFGPLDCLTTWLVGTGNGTACVKFEVN